MKGSVRPPHGASVLRLRSALLICILVGCVGPAIPVKSQQLAAQQRRVQGRVMESLRGASLRGTAITVLGADAQALTDSAGRYQLTVPPGLQRIRAASPGYLRQTREITVPPGQTVVLDFVLSRADSPERRQHAVLVPPGADTLPTERLTFSVPDSVRIRYRQMRYRSFTPRPGDTINLPLFADVDLLARSTRVVTLADGHARWIGELLDEHGLAYGSVILVVRGNRLTGNIHFDGRVFEIRPYGGGVHLVIELDSRRFPPEPPLPPPLPPPEFPPLPEPWPPWLPPYRPAPWIDPVALGRVAVQCATGCSDLQNLITSPEVRLLVVYSQNVATTPPADVLAVDNIVDEIDIMFVQLEDALRTSMIPVQVALAHVAEVTVDDLHSIGSTMQLDRLTDPDDGHADGVHALRDRYHADLVVLLLEHMAGSRANTLVNVSLAHENAAFAVVNRGQATVDFSFTHEVGHLLSAQHDRGQSVPEGLPYRYNFGYVQPQGSGTLAPDFTVMARRSTGERLNRFSNPEQAWRGQALGAPSTAPDAADNSRALGNAVSIVSAFRLTPVWFVSLAGVGPWAAKLVTDDPLDGVRFGDFDGDSETDAFRVNTAAGTWEWSRSGSFPWATLYTPGAGAPGLRISELGFGDFDGDGKTDVFHSDIAAGKWLWWSRAIGTWAVLNAQPAPVLQAAELAFADFNNDGKTDVFWSDVAGMRWRWSNGGAAQWTDLQAPNADLAVAVRDLGFADFDGDGASDVFRADPPGQRWLWSRSGTGPWAVLNAGPALTPGIRDLAFGAFDDDLKADVFTADGTNWLMSSGGTAPWQIVRTSCHRLPELRFGDFDGDGTTDVIRAGIRP